MIESFKISVTTTGSAGSATGSENSARPLCGELLALYVDWGATAPGATSDVSVVVASDDNHPQVTLYSKDNSATDAWVYPVVQNTDTGGSAVAGQYQHIAVTGRITVSVTGCNALDPAVTVYGWLKS